ncbi:ABC transporter substrate-binding protein [Noviherbaspirillum galbum]|uniref:ABC transporter substrate-binding protein n=1 Tax=Noviherbaspirillum galbum TaxID=2709383 RepID=A0A6B3SUK2_9BURK|nr:ABC transporter substrate-binding protein [Noviherbaspirillum galbum]NEX64700.1 ABC transporter substrate-binding protein [Noviherbaspirillum galbum]
MISRFSAALTVALAMSVGTAQADVIKVGVIAPMSGTFALTGQTWEGAIKAYQKLHGTTAGGHTIEVIYRDMPEINPAQARALAQELVVKEGVQYLAGLYFTPDALAVAALAQEAKVPVVIFNASTSAILDKSEYLLRTSYTLPQVGVPVAKYALEKNVKRVVTLVSDFGPGLDAEKAFTTAFAAGGGKLLENIRAPLKTTDFGPLMQRVKSLKPDALYVFAPGGPLTYALIKAYNEAGLKAAGVRFLGTAETDEDQLQTMGPEVIGFETGMYYSASHNSAVNNAAVKALREVAPKAVPTVQLVNAFDGLHVIYHMVEATNGQRNGAKAIASAKGFSWESPRGPLKIDPNTRDLLQNVYMRVVEKDPAGRYINREIRTFEMQPDYGRAPAAAK